jgi:hypothetical protein
MKVIDTPGTRALDDGFTTQDFLLVNHPTLTTENGIDARFTGRSVAFRPDSSALAALSCGSARRRGGWHALGQRGWPQPRCRRSPAASSAV